MSIFLGVNIDHIATLRQARKTRYPSPIEAALLAETAGIMSASCAGEVISRCGLNTTICERINSNGEIERVH